MISIALGSSSCGGESYAHLYRVLDEAGCSALAQRAEGLADDVFVHLPFRDRQGGESGPCLGVTLCFAGEHVVEGAR